MRILITGGLGHIGSSLINKLTEHHLTVIDNLSSNRFISLINSKNKIKFLLLDLSYKKSFKTLKNFDLIIHLAAKTDAAQSHLYEREFDRNFLITKNIIKYVIDNKKTKLIFASTTSVYGPQSDIVDENCTYKDLNPQSPYAANKLREEKFIKKKLINHKNKYNILRLGTIYGVSSGIRFHTAVNKFCFQASLGIPLTIWKTAYSQYRPYLSLQDLSKAVNLLINKNIYNNTIYNVVSSNYKVSDIIEIIKKYKKIKIVYVSHKIMNQMSYIVKNDKFTKLGFKFNPSLDKNIKQTLELFKNIKND